MNYSIKNIHHIIIFYLNFCYYWVGKIQNDIKTSRTIKVRKFMQIFEPLRNRPKKKTLATHLPLLQILTGVHR